MISQSSQHKRVEQEDHAEEAIRVLVVDDEEHFRAGIRRIFRVISRKGRAFQFEEAGSAAEAFQRIEENAPDCVLLDFKMPCVDGLAALSRIQSLDDNVAVIMVTGHGDEEVAVSALKWGASDYLVKGSISPETLSRSLSNAFEKTRMKRALQAQREKLAEAERQRVMIQSLGAACHHLGQPATSLMCYLEIMKKQSAGNDEMTELIDQCNASAESIAEILQQLQRVSAYRTVPYLTFGDGTSAKPDAEILDIA